MNTRRCFFLFAIAALATAGSPRHSPPLASSHVLEAMALQGVRARRRSSPRAESPVADASS